MNTRFIEVGLKAGLFAGVMLLLSCTSFPVQELSDARQAIDAAESANASSLAAVEYQEARILLKDADRFIAEGRYDLAKKVARNAKKAAMQARRKAIELAQ